MRAAGVPELVAVAGVLGFSAASVVTAGAGIASVTGTGASGAGIGACTGCGAASGRWMGVLGFVGVGGVGAGGVGMMVCGISTTWVGGSIARIGSGSSERCCGNSSNSAAAALTNSAALPAVMRIGSGGTWAGEAA